MNYLRDFFRIFLDFFKYLGRFFVAMFKVAEKVIVWAASHIEWIVGVILLGIVVAILWKLVNLIFGQQQ